MTVKVSVIGPKDLVEVVLSLHTEFPSLNLKGHPYASEAEVLPVFRQTNADMYIFTGPIPYFTVKDVYHPPQPMMFVPLTGSGLISALLQIHQAKLKKINALSVDVIEDKSINEALVDANMPNVKVFSKIYSGTTSTEELVKFHTDLYEQGKTSVALTCLRSTYKQLKTKGIPSWRVLPTRSDVRETLQRAVVQGEQLWSKETQVAVQICEVDDIEKFSNHPSSEYNNERLLLALHNSLNDYAEKTWSFVHATSKNCFTIFTTRGILEKHTNFFQTDPLLLQIRDQLKISVNIGIGLGRTAYHAEYNARQALERARADGGGCSYALTDNGNLIGPLGGNPPLKSLVITKDANQVAAAEKSRLSVETISKISFLIEILGQDTITASDLAKGLKISKRNARRILTHLTQSDLAKICGEEQSSKIGRPQRIYQLTLLGWR